MKYKTFDILNDYGIKNAFIYKSFDFGNNNLNRREELATILDVDENKIYFSKQNHTSKVEVVYDNDSIDNQKFIDNDGLITNVKGVTLLTYVADCQGIFLYDPVKKVIGNVHSGWKGIATKIVINAINKMIDEFNSDKKDILCFINPSIHSCHFEIEDDVLNYFKDKLGNMVENYITFAGIKNGKNKYHLDLINLNKQILIDFGIKCENIFILDECTVCNKEYHSYRREKTESRNGCVISL